MVAKFSDMERKQQKKHAYTEKEKVEKREKAKIERRETKKQTENDAGRYLFVV